MKALHMKGVVGVKSITLWDMQEAWQPLEWYVKITGVRNWSEARPPGPPYTWGYVYSGLHNSCPVQGTGFQVFVNNNTIATSMA